MTRFPKTVGLCCQHLNHCVTNYFQLCDVMTVWPILHDWQTSVSWSQKSEPLSRPTNNCKESHNFWTARLKNKQRTENQQTMFEQSQGKPDVWDSWCVDVSYTACLVLCNLIKSIFLLLWFHGCPIPHRGWESHAKVKTNGVDIPVWKSESEHRVEVFTSKISSHPIEWKPKLCCRSEIKSPPCPPCSACPACW